MSYEIHNEARELAAIPFGRAQQQIQRLRRAMPGAPTSFTRRTRKPVPLTAIVRGRHGQRRRVRPGQLPRKYQLAQGGVGMDGLGFSLKPPKFVRKAFTAVKKQITLKRALEAGAIVGGAMVLGPAALAVAKGAGGLIRAGAVKLVSAGRGLEQEIARDARAAAAGRQTPPIVPMPPGYAPNAPDNAMIPGNPYQLGPQIAAMNNANVEAATGEPMTVTTTAPDGDPVEVKPVLTPPAAAPIHPLVLTGVGYLLLQLLKR